MSMVIPVSFPSTYLERDRVSYSPDRICVEPLTSFGSFHPVPLSPNSPRLARYTWATRYRRASGTSAWPSARSTPSHTERRGTREGYLTQISSAICQDYIKTDNLCSFLCHFKASFKMMSRMDQDRDDGDPQGYGNVKMLLIRTGAYFPSPSSPCAGASCWVCASAAGSSVIYSAVPKGMRTPLSPWNDASSFSKYSLGRQLVPEVV